MELFRKKGLALFYLFMVVNANIFEERGKLFITAGHYFAHYDIKVNDVIKQCKDLTAMVQEQLDERQVALPRYDLRCGPGNNATNIDLPAPCDPKSAWPCCSDTGYCGTTCHCPTCVDHRDDEQAVSQMTAMYFKVEGACQTVHGWKTLLQPNNFHVQREKRAVVVAGMAIALIAGFAGYALARSISYSDTEGIKKQLADLDIAISDARDELKKYSHGMTRAIAYEAFVSRIEHYAANVRSLDIALTSAYVDNKVNPFLLGREAAEEIFKDAMDKAHNKELLGLLGPRIIFDSAAQLVYDQEEDTIVVAIKIPLVTDVFTEYFKPDFPAFVPVDGQLNPYVFGQSEYIAVNERQTEYVLMTSQYSCERTNGISYCEKNSVKKNFDLGCTAAMFAQSWTTAVEICEHSLMREEFMVRRTSAKTFLVAINMEEMKFVHSCQDPSNNKIETLKYGMRNVTVDDGCICTAANSVILEPLDSDALLYQVRTTNANVFHDGKVTDAFVHSMKKSIRKLEEDAAENGKKLSSKWNIGVSIEQIAFGSSGMLAISMSVNIIQACILNKYNQ